MTWWRHQLKIFSALLALCAGNSPVPVNSPHKGQWCGALMFSSICSLINRWVNNREAGDLRCHRAHYDANIMNAVSLKHDQYSEPPLLCCHSCSLAYTSMRIQSTNMFSTYFQIYCGLGTEAHCFYECVYQTCPQTLAVICRNIGICDVFTALAREHIPVLSSLFSKIFTWGTYTAARESKIWDVFYVFKVWGLLQGMISLRNSPKTQSSRNICSSI